MRPMSSTPAGLRPDSTQSAWKEPTSNGTIRTVRVGEQAAELAAQLVGIAGVAADAGRLARPGREQMAQTRRVQEQGGLQSPRQAGERLEWDDGTAETTNHLQLDAVQAARPV